MVEPEGAAMGPRAIHLKLLLLAICFISVHCQQADSENTVAKLSYIPCTANETICHNEERVTDAGLSGICSKLPVPVEVCVCDNGAYYAYGDICLRQKRETNVPCTAARTDCVNITHADESQCGTSNGSSVCVCQNGFSFFDGRCLAIKDMPTRTLKTCTGSAADCPRAILNIDERQQWTGFLDRVCVMNEEKYCECMPGFGFDPFIGRCERGYYYGKSSSHADGLPTHDVRILLLFLTVSSLLASATSD